MGSFWLTQVVFQQTHDPDSQSAGGRRSTPVDQESQTQVYGERYGRGYPTDTQTVIKLHFCFYDFIGR